MVKLGIRRIEFSGHTPPRNGDHGNRRKKGNPKFISNFEVCENHRSLHWESQPETSTKYLASLFRRAYGTDSDKPRISPAISSRARRAAGLAHGEFNPKYPLLRRSTDASHH